MQSRNHKFTQTGTVPTAKRWSRRTLRRSVTGVLVAAVMATSALPAQAAPQPKLSTQGSIDALARELYSRYPSSINATAATLPEVTGSKWGWSDDRRSIHASASIGSNFAIAAHTFGTKETHTQDVQAAFGPQPLPQRLQPQPPQLESPALPGMPGWPGVPGWPAVPGLLEAPALPAIPGLRSPGFS